MSTRRRRPVGLPRDVRAGLLVLALVIVALALLVVGVRYWTDDSPRAKLASSAVVPPSSAIPLSPGETYVLTEALPSGDLVVTHWISSEEPLDTHPAVAARSRGHETGDRRPGPGYGRRPRSWRAPS